MSIIPSDAELSDSSSGSDKMSRAAKLPEFWSETPAIWFERAEGEFAIKGITQEVTKYSYLVGALPQAVATRVQDALLNRHATTPYTVLKDRLVKTFTPTPYQQGKQLIELAALPAERPTVLLDRMMTLLPASVDRDKPGFLFETLFLEKLPPDVRAHVCHLELPVREIAERADLHWSSRPPASVAAVDSAAVPPPDPCLQCDASAVCAVQRRRRLCFYHARFGNRAAKCEDPCDWRPKQAGNGRGRK